MAWYIILVYKNLAAPLPGNHYALTRCCPRGGGYWEIIDIDTEAETVILQTGQERFVGDDGKRSFVFDGNHKFRWESEYVVFAWEFVREGRQSTQ